MKYDLHTCKAFVLHTTVAPYQIGALDGLKFAVKDLIDIKGFVTGCGNPTWAKTHAEAATNAICVEQLLAEGATCVGKTITDELAFSLVGENHFDGTPINPRAPDRVPGGSSSGSASAVACGVVDFALGTDTSGSVRVPANNCGIWGYRPSHDRISLCGVNPLALSFDTVGVLAKDVSVLEKTVSVLLASDIPAVSKPQKIWLLQDMFSMCDKEIKEALQPVFQQIEKIFPVEKITLSEIVGTDINYDWLCTTYSRVQLPEIYSTLGTWIESIQPEFGPITAKTFELINTVKRNELQLNLKKRALFLKKINAHLQPHHFFLIPTAPALAPKLNTMSDRTKGDYYPRLLALNSIAGLARLPQITIPKVTIDNVPIGFSLLAGHWQDEELIALVKQV